MTEPNSALVDLEMKVVFLERTVDELNDVILDQGKSIDALVLRLRLLEERLRQSAGEATGEEERSPEDDRPPHW